MIDIGYISKVGVFCRVWWNYGCKVKICWKVRLNYNEGVGVCL